MKISLFLFPVLVACGGLPEHESPCGMRVIGKGDAYNALFDAAETDAIAYLHKWAKFDENENLCYKVRGWRVSVWETELLELPDRSLCGRTFCAYDEIQIGNVPPHESSLLHEMAHAILRCERDETQRDPDHPRPRWDSIRRASDLFNGIEPLPVLPDGGTP